MKNILSSLILAVLIAGIATAESNITTTTPTYTTTIPTYVTTLPTICTDTDNGINYYYKGMIGTSRGWQSDTCIDSTRLIEYYCSAGRVFRTIYKCPYGCSAGACQLSTCSETDGGRNYYARGDLGSTNLGNKTDTCVDAMHLKEYYCYDSTYGSLGYGVNYKCPYGCSRGACKQAPGSSWCYQESADVATSCGGLSTGGYVFPEYCHHGDGATTSNCSELNDGNWDTAAFSIDRGFYYVNYSTPSKALPSSMWVIKDEYTTKNLSIPQGCWGTALFLRVESGPVYSPAFACYDTAHNTWIQLYKSSSGTGSWVYEEAMLWRISSTTTTTRAVTTTTRTPCK
jgi:hypothetical protein